VSGKRARLEACLAKNYWLAAANLQLPHTSRPTCTTDDGRLFEPGEACWPLRAVNLAEVQR